MLYFMQTHVNIISFIIGPNTAVNASDYVHLPAKKKKKFCNLWEQ